LKKFLVESGESIHKCFILQTSPLFESPNLANPDNADISQNISADALDRIGLFTILLFCVLQVTNFFNPLVCYVHYEKVVRINGVTDVNVAATDGIGTDGIIAAFNLHVAAPPVRDND